MVYSRPSLARSSDRELDTKSRWNQCSLRYDIRTSTSRFLLVIDPPAFILGSTLLLLQVPQSSWSSRTLSFLVYLMFIDRFGWWFLLSSRSMWHWSYQTFAQDRQWQKRGERRRRATTSRWNNDLQMHESREETLVWSADRFIRSSVHQSINQSSIDDENDDIERLA